MENGMTNAEFNAFLETLAKLVEATAKTPEEAVRKGILLLLDK